MSWKDSLCLLYVCSSCSSPQNKSPERTQAQPVPSSVHSECAFAFSSPKLEPFPFQAISKGVTLAKSWGQFLPLSSCRASFPGAMQSGGRRPGVWPRRGCEEHEALPPTILLGTSKLAAHTDSAGTCAHIVAYACLLAITEGMCWNF